MNRRTVQKIFVVLMLLTFGYIIGAVSKNYSLAYNRPEYELISFDPIKIDKTGDPQRRARQIVEQLEQAEEQLDKMGSEGWELHSFWGNVAIFER
jgi:hypothetical protein